MAKSADAADLKSAGRKAVGVQVPLWAPTQGLAIFFNRRHGGIFGGVTYSIFMNLRSLRRASVRPSNCDSVLWATVILAK
jgi:hypothetical protein